MLDAPSFDVTQLAPPPRIERRISSTETSKVLGDVTSTAQPASGFFVAESYRVYRANVPVSGSPDAFNPRTAPGMPEPTELGRLEVARDTRVELLAQKYESGSATREELARIGILTERLNALAPRTTSADVDALAGAVSAIESLDAGLCSYEEDFS